MTAGTVADMLEVARGELGYREAAGNRTKFGKWYGLDGQPWCAMFTSWCFAQIGTPRGGMTHTAWTPGIYQAARRAGRWHERPDPGDLVLFCFMAPSKQRPLGICHVGIVERVHGDTITTIEGNTDAAGSRTGGQVMRKTRRTRIAGYARPVYAEVVGPALGSRILKLRQPHMSGPDVLAWQRDFLVPWRRKVGGEQVITPAGNYLQRTAAETRRMQRHLGVDDDGEVGSITLKAARKWRDQHLN